MRELVMWTIYDHPSDYPNTFVCRKWAVDSESCGKTPKELQQQQDMIDDILTSAYVVAIVFGPGESFRKSLPDDQFKILEWRHEEYLAGRLRFKAGSPPAFLTAVVHGNAGSEREKMSWQILLSGNRELITKFQGLVMSELFASLP